MRKIYVLSVALIMLNIFWQKSLIAQDTCPEILMHYWRLDRIQENTFTDYAGNLNADVLVTTTPVPGKVDSSQYFTGASKVDIPAHESFDWSANSSFTIEFWVNKPDACQVQNSSGNNVILGRDDPTNSNLHWWTGISCTNPGKVAFNLYANNGNGHSVESKKAIIDTSWHLVALVRNGTANTTSIYIDGIRDTTVSHTFTDGFSSEVPINLGWLNLGSNFFFKGKLDELAVYDSVLVDSVIAGHYNSGAGKVYCKTSDTGIDSSDFETDFYSLTMNFTGMDTAVGHEFRIRLVEVDDRKPFDSLQISSVDSSAYAVVFDSLRNDSYNIDFWVDINDNGSYDVPPADQAWRIPLMNVVSDTVLDFAYNTTFTDIFEQPVDTTEPDNSGYALTLEFTGFVAETDHNMTIYLRNPESDEFIDSLVFTPLDSGMFTVTFDSLESGDLHVDFYSDFNDNGTYDTPPADHAWRLPIDELNSDTTITVTHTLMFTDIFESDTVVADSNYRIVLNMTGFTTNVGQNLLVYLRDPVSGDFIDSIMVTPLENADFDVEFDSVEVNNYNVDFYFDVNQNGTYDIPPVDQAWRIELINLNADTTITYVYNTSYTDIGIVVVGIDRTHSEYFRAYPNPAGNVLYVDLLKDARSISVYNSAGAVMIHKLIEPAARSVKIDITSLKPGIYILDVKGDQNKAQYKFVKK